FACFIFGCDGRGETGRTDRHFPVTATAVDRKAECKSVDLHFAPDKHPSPHQELSLKSWIVT
ncbi:MAG: hypothetical protein WCB47_11080, partial [Pseudolabrys sp.]